MTEPQAAKPPKAAPKAEPQGVVFPKNDKGERSTTSAGKAVWIAAVEGLDPALAAAIAREKDWRHQYNKYVVAVAEVGSAHDRNDSFSLARAAWLPSWQALPSLKELGHAVSSWKRQHRNGHLLVTTSTTLFDLRLNRAPVP